MRNSTHKFIKLIKFTLTVALLSLVAALPSFAQKNSITVGATAGPHSEILEEVKKEAQKKGLSIKIIEFSDYVQPNAALAGGDLDANSYQHQPYLDLANADRNYNLVSIAKTIVLPIGIYSKKVQSLQDLKNGNRVAIPNDPTNGARALLVLEKAGVIKLNPVAKEKASILDITDNPRNLRIIELDAAQLPRSLDDVDAAAVNTNFALEAGLDPNKDAIAMESSDSPYANVIAVRANDKDKTEFKTFTEAYRSAPVKAFIENKYKKSIVPTW